LTLFWLDEEGIVNVVSLMTLKERFHLIYDSTRGEDASPAPRLKERWCFPDVPPQDFPTLT
jgi:hypothetical protein